MRARAFTFDRSTAEPEAGKPASDRLIAGNPQFRTWNVEERDGLYAGIWESTPGKWRIAYEEWEYFHILEGHSIVTSDTGEVFDLPAGTSMVIRSGFNGTWEVLETTVKDYVIKV